MFLCEQTRLSSAILGRGWPRVRGCRCDLFTLASRLSNSKESETTTRDKIACNPATISFGEETRFREEKRSSLSARDATRRDVEKGGKISFEGEEA